MKLSLQWARLLLALLFESLNNREIRQSRLSVSGHGFEPEKSHIQSRIYTVFLYRFSYKISEVKQRLPSVKWSFSGINFIVSLICLIALTDFYLANIIIQFQLTIPPKPLVVVVLCWHPEEIPWLSRRRSIMQPSRNNENYKKCSGAMVAPEEIPWLSR